MHQGFEGVVVTGFNALLDSKTLTEAEREALFEKLDAAKSYVGWALQVLSPNTISNSMLQRYRTSRGNISHFSAAVLTLKQLLLLGPNTT